MLVGLVKLLSLATTSLTVLMVVAAFAINVREARAQTNAGCPGSCCVNAAMPCSKTQTGCSGCDLYDCISPQQNVCKK